MSLKRITLRNFRSFKHYSITLEDKNFLVGPNNAGKTTVLTALRLVDIMIRYARSRNPDDRRVDKGLALSTYPIPSAALEFQSVLESIHYNFEESEARIDLEWSNGNTLTAVWPPLRSSDLPYFYLLTKKGNIHQPRNKAKVKEEFDRLGIVPVLSPLDYKEQMLNEKYIKLNADGRIASRHFRNHLQIMKKEGKFEAFKSLVEKWLPEIELKDPEFSLQLDNPGINIYYRDNDQSTDKEIIWAGDGIQIWLQLLFHFFRIRQSQTLILDEPEVYLHSDLQRRLIKLLDSTGSQIIVATHSTEMISNTDPGSVIMIDRKHKKGIKLRTEEMYGELTELMGSGVDLRLVRALRTKVILFVEGQDMKLLDIVAEKMGLNNIHFENNITIIPLGGKSNQSNVEPFLWLSKNLLSDSKVISVLLDRDYQSDGEVQEFEQAFNEVGVQGHMWRLKELESYFIKPEPISRITGLSLEDVSDIIMSATNNLKGEVTAQLTRSYALSSKKDKASTDITAVVRLVTKDIEHNWSSIDYRLSVCPAKLVIKEINKILIEKNKRSIDVIKVARQMSPSEINKEMRDILTAIDAECDR